jgi:hypothetical protein
MATDKLLSGAWSARLEAAGPSSCRLERRHSHRIREFRISDANPARHAPRMDFLAKARHVIEIETGALQRMAARLDEGFARAVTMLHETLDRRGKIVVVGIGSRGTSATRSPPR